MADDDYELLPHAELEHLRREVNKLKRNPLGDTQASISLLESISELNENVKRLVQIFQSANDDMSRLAREGSMVEQIRRLRDENAKIAHGIVALSEMLEGHKSSVPDETPMPEPEKHESPPSDLMDDIPESAFSMPEPEEPKTPPQQPGQQQDKNPFMDDNPFPQQDESKKDQITGEPLPPPPRR